MNHKPRSTLSFIADRANLVTLAGLVCGISSIYLSVQKIFAAATLALLWALLCDWMDGPIARRMRNRTDIDRAFGGQLDSLVDLVCSGVAPAMLLLAISEFNPWFLPGAFVLVIAGAIRLAHFNTIDSGDAYSGLPIDTNIVVVTGLLALRGAIPFELFPWVLYVGVVTLAILNVAPFRMPKPTLRWYYAITAYVVGMTAFTIRGMLVT
ncbi:MAG: CDP-alcohol phosphatidyltransferase family protein [Nannocystaceae bacterium]